MNNQLVSLQPAGQTDVCYPYLSGALEGDTAHTEYTLHYYNFFIKFVYILISVSPATCWLSCWLQTFSFPGINKQTLDTWYFSAFLLQVLYTFNIFMEKSFSISAFKDVLFQKNLSTKLARWIMKSRSWSELFSKPDSNLFEPSLMFMIVMSWYSCFVLYPLPCSMFYISRSFQSLNSWNVVWRNVVIIHRYISWNWKGERALR